MSFAFISGLNPKIIPSLIFHFKHKISVAYTWSQTNEVTAKKLTPYVLNIID